MKSTLFKSISFLILAIFIANTHFTASAQTMPESKEEAKQVLYYMAKEVGYYFNQVDFGGTKIDEFSYNGEVLTIAILSNDMDVRYLTSDMVVIQFHNLCNNPDKRKSYVTMSTLLRQAESNLRVVYHDDIGHSVEHIFSPDDIDNILSKPIEELGIDPQQMSEYCIFYHNSLMQSDVDGEYILSAKASKKGDFVKMSILTSFNNELLSVFTPEIIKEKYLSSFGDTDVMLRGYANQLDAFGYKGIILEYTNNQGYSQSATITTDDIINYSSSKTQLWNADAHQQPSTTLNSTSTNSKVEYFVNSFDASFKNMIGDNGLIDASAKLNGEYIEITQIYDYSFLDIDHFDIPSFKEGYLEDSDSEYIESYLSLKELGLKGFIFVFKNSKYGPSKSVTLSFDEIINATSPDKNNSSSEISSLGFSTEDLSQHIATLSEADKKALTDTFLSSIENGAKGLIGSDGITDVHVFTSGDYAVLLLSVENVSDLTESDLSFIKHSLLQEFRDNELINNIAPLIQQATGIKGIKYIYKDINSYKSATITIDFNEINNHTSDNQRDYPNYDNEYDFSEASTDELKEIFIQELNTSLKEGIGEDGLTDAGVNLSGETLVMTFTFDNSIDFNNIGDLNELKNDLIQDMTATEEDLEMCMVLYYLDIKEIKIVIKCENSRKQKTFSISIEDIVNGTFDPEDIQYEI